MAKLVIKGHPTRGEEVIRILEMLGGINKTEYNGDQEFAYYFINNNYIDWCHEFIPEIDFICFTLEEFLEEFPYKVGDKVSSKYLKNYEVSKMEWGSANNRVIYKLQGMGWYSADELQPYKEEPMENKGTLVEIDLTREESKAEEIEVILGDYEFILKDGKTYFVKKKPQYPKTYKECFNICFGNHHPVVQVVGLDSLGNNKSLFERFIKLKICRDAYWKIAGEQLGLDRSWEYDMSKDEFSYAISYQYGYIQKNEIRHKNTILAFPTAEIRDTFKENFDDDIEFCKEFL